MKLIIDIDEEMYKRICGAQSAPDMYGTDVVNAINRIKKGIPCNNLQQGEWLWLGDNPNPNHKWSCNKCGRGVKEQENFCPNCGAKMGSKEE